MSKSFYEKWNKKEFTRAKELQNYLNEIKPLLVGKSLSKIMMMGVNFNDNSENETAGFKLVLTFPPKTGTTQTPHCTVTIYDREIIIGHHSQWPLQTRYHWLTVFGF